MKNKLEPISKEAHQALKIKNDHGYSHAEKQHFTVVTIHEIAQAATSYPVVLAKNADSGQYRLVAMFGFEPGQNFYLAKGKWDAVYIPMNILRYPFSFVRDENAPEDRNMVMCLDSSSDYLTEETGTPLFDEEGKPSSYLESMKNLLANMTGSDAVSGEFIQMLIDLDLLASIEMMTHFTEGEPKNYIGMYTIDERKLAQLSDEQVLSLHKKNYLGAIYSMLVSLGQINRLVQMRNTQPGPAIASINVSIGAVANEKSEEAVKES